MSRSLPSHTRRLAELVCRPGGLTATEAVAAAEARLDTIRDSSIKEIGSMVDNMIVMGEGLLKSRTQEACDSLYVASNSVVGVAGVFALNELGEVAFSLCKLLDCQRTSGVWSAPALRLHLDSLKIMFGEEDGAAKRTVVDALHKVVDRVSRRSEN